MKNENGSDQTFRSETTIKPIFQYMVMYLEIFLDF